MQHPRKRSKSLKKFSPSALLLLLAFSALPLEECSAVVDGTWEGNVTPDNWSAASEWTTNPDIPESAGDTANFPEIISQGYQVTLDIAVTLGVLNIYSFDSDYTIANDGSTLTFDNSLSDGSITLTNGGNLTISCPVDIEGTDTLQITSTTGATNILGFTGPITGPASDILTVNLSSPNAQVNFTNITGTPNSLNTLNLSGGKFTINNSPTFLTTNNLVIDGADGFIDIINQLYDGTTAGNLTITSSGVCKLTASQIVDTFTLTGPVASLVQFSGGDLTINTLLSIGDEASIPDAFPQTITLSTAANLEYTGGGTSGAFIRTDLDIENPTPTFMIAGTTFDPGFTIASGIGSGVPSFIPTIDIVSSSGTATIQFSGNENNDINATVETNVILELNKTSAYAITDSLTINGTVKCLSSNQIHNTPHSRVNLETGGTFNLNGTTQQFGGFFFSGGSLGTGGIMALQTELFMDENTNFTNTLKANSSNFIVVFVPTTPINQSAIISGEFDLGTNTAVEISVEEDASNTLTISGAISNGGILKDGPGTLILSAASGTNVYAAGTEISDGTLETDTANTLPSSGTVNLSSATAVLSLVGNSQNIGNLTGVTSSSVDLGSTSGTILTFGGDGGSAAFDGVISGTGSIIKTGTGTTTLGAAQGYTGNTTINDGTLTMGVMNTLPTSTTVTLNSGGTWNFGGFTQEVATFTYTAGTLMQGGETLTIDTQLNLGLGTNISGPLAMASGSPVIEFNPGGTSSATISGTLDLGGNTAQEISVINSSSPLTISGAISDGGILKDGAGVLILSASSGNNTYSSGTNISAGTVQTGALDTLPPTGTVNLSASGAVLSLIDPTNSSNSFSQSIGNLSGVAGTTVQLGTLPATSLTIGGDNTAATFFGAVKGSGQLIKEGTGTATFEGSNIFSGGTTINLGTLALSNSGSLLGTGPVTLSGGNFDISDSTAGQIIGDLNGTSGGIYLGGNNLTVTTTATTETFGGTINNGGIGGGTLGSLTVTGAGTLVLSGTNTYSGKTTITQGSTLSVSADANLGNGGGVTFNGTTTGGTLAITSSSFTSAKPLTMTEQALISTGTGIDATLSGISSGSAGLTKNGDGILRLTGSNGYLGPTIINAGTLAIGGSLNSSTDLTLNNSGSVFDISLSSGVAIGDLVSGDSGTMISLGGQNLTITTSVNTDSYAGTIQDTSVISPIATGGSLTVAGTGKLTLTAGNSYTGGTTISGGTLALSGAGALDLTGSVDLTGSSAVFDISLVTLGTTDIGNLSGTAGSIQLGNNNLTVSASGTPAAFAGVIKDTGSGTLSVLNTGTLTLSGINTYAGLTSVGGSATLAISLGGDISSSSGVSLSGTSTFDISGATGGVSIGDLNAIAGTFVTLGSNALTVTTTGADLFAGKMTGDTTSGILNVNGSGQLTIDAASTLSDYAATNVNATLIVDGTLTNPVGVTVNSGGFLQGTGIIAGPTTISNGGTLTPGNSIGTINISGNYTQSPGSTLVIEANSLGDSSSVSVTGGNAVVTGSNLQMNFDPPPPAYTTGMTWTVVTVSGGTVTGDFASITSRSSLVQLTATYNLTDIIITLGGFTPIVTIVNQGNPGAVASCVDATTATPGSDLASIIAALLPLSTPELYNAFNQMQPSAFKGLAVSQQNIFLEVENVLTHRFLSFFPTACEEKKPIKKTAIWLDGFVSNQTQGEKTVAPYSPQPAYTTSTFAILLGVDTNISKNFSIGACTGYSRGIYSMHSDAGNGDVDSFYIGPYMKFGHENAEISPYLTLSLLGEANWYGTNRDINFSDISRTAHSSHTGQGLLFHAGGGAWIKAGKFDISPFVNFDLIAMQENAYNESGAGSLNLHVNPATYQFNELEGGILLRNCINIPHGMIVPEISLSVLHEVRSQGDDYEASLAGTDGCEFIVKGYYPDRTLFIPAAEIKAFLFDERFTASLYYQGKFGDDFSQNELGLQFAWNF